MSDIYAVKLTRQAYRAIYTIEKDRVIKFVAVQGVNKHEY